MSGKQVDTRVLRAQAAAAGNALDRFAKARTELTELAKVLAGDHWGSSAEAAGLRDVLLSTLINRMAEVNQLTAAALKVRDGLLETADDEERTEEAVADLFRPGRIT
ncbi:hypothetical protein [Saccharothrix syringae]|uniref:Uncharacterized protein n=1 Tax=Saccharothrix syringae TaxID=103733 RepID=A0A5Q0GW84_SACSY|nr:hypothetical protein [Saccharothrix syringae]QFZ18386.1 hypothetical protein EKG83_13625 [Saccharothrix syringae]